jgi:hypothetical protein
MAPSCAAGCNYALSAKGQKLAKCPSALMSALCQKRAFEG